MNTTINWKELDDREKTRLIIEHIMQWSYFESWETFHKQAPKDAYPAVFWENQPYGHSCWSVFYEPERNARVFDPLHCMDDAWLLIEKLETSATLNYTPAFVPDYPEGRAAHYECEIVELDPICGNDRIARAIANSAPEAICIAALRWVGIQVTDTIEAIQCWQVTFEDGQKMIFGDRAHAEHQLAIREQYLKNNLQWAKNVRKLKIEEMNVPEDYFNGPEIG